MPSKLEQLQLQFRQKLLLEKEEKMVKIHSDGQPKPESKISENGGCQPKNSASHVAPYTPSPKANSTPVSRYTQSAKKGTSGLDRSRPLPPIQKNPKIGSPALSSTLTSPGNFSHVKNSIENGTPARSPAFEIKPSVSKSVSNGKAKLSGETFKVVHTETRLRQVEVEKPKPVKKLSSDRETRTKVNTPTSSRTPEHRDTTDGKLNSASKLKLRQEIKSTPTRRDPLPVKKPVNGALSRMSKSQPDPNLAECTICGRRFAKDRIEKHSTICKKSEIAQKKRKIFDATKMRVKGTEAEGFLRKKNLKIDVAKPKKSNWRKQHETFLASIREAKAVQRHLAAGGKISDLPPPTPSDNSDYVQCPYCKRKFNEAAAERHIPKCKNILSNKKTKK